MLGEKKNHYSRAERDRVKGGGKAGNTNQSYNYAKKKTTYYAR